MIFRLEPLWSANWATQAVSEQVTECVYDMLNTQAPKFFYKAKKNDLLFLGHWHIRFSTLLKKNYKKNCAYIFVKLNFVLKKSEVNFFSPHSYSFFRKKSAREKEKV